MIQELHACFQGPRQVIAQALLQRLQALTQFGAIRTGEFGGRCWRGGTLVGGEIGNGEISFMAYTGDDRNPTGQYTER